MPRHIPHITIRYAFGNQRDVEMSRTPFTLGRQGGNDLVLLDTRISRYGSAFPDASTTRFLTKLAPSYRI
jgi:hypothetical protein